MNVTVSGAGKERWGAGGMVVVVGEGGRGGIGGQEMHKELLIGLRGHRPPLH